MGDIKAVYEIIKDISPYYKKKGEPEAEHKLVYDSSTETLEPVYFFILDLMQDLGMKTEKLSDNFASSPGSGHFSELGQRATIMQQQGAKILGDVNTVLRSVLNLIYDLKEFKIRLKIYTDLKSKDPNISQAARLSLKQLWMDKVDIQKGNSSVKAMALGQAGFQTLLDAFLVADNEKEAKDLDLNDRIKRIVMSRVIEFNAWLGQSERELTKRYGLERAYLKSQVNSLKLYTKWAKPYLVAAAKLQNKDFGRDPALVNVFNTLLLELTLLGKQELKIKEEALEGNLPIEFSKEHFLKSIKRKYYSCYLVDFRFRGIPQRVAQQSHYAFGGLAEVTFRGYALNEEEIAKLYQEIDKSDLELALGFVEGASDESLKQMQEEIDFFLSEEDEKPVENKDSSNPFLALFGFYDKKEASKSKPKEEKQKKKEIGEIKKDSWIEKEHLRKLCTKKAQEATFNLFEIYKKAHGMPAYT
ncbi:MAG: hypothetical protein AABW51_02225 [Nanoarchaeota archaeon]